MDNYIDDIIAYERNNHSIDNFILETNSTVGSDNSPFEIWNPSVNTIRGICLVIISILGASFNIFMIVAIVPNRRLRTVRNILLVHLGVVGLMSSIFTTLYPAMTTFHGKWLGGRPMCQVYAYITCVLTTMAVWTITALSWDKYKIIASPLHHSLIATIRKMMICFTLFWIGGLTLSLPPIFINKEFLFPSHMGICGLSASSTAGRWYTCFLICIAFVCPFGLMVYCYAHIFRIARTQSGRIASTMLRMVNVIQAPITSSNHSSISLRGTKAMGTIFQLIGSFVLTYLPYGVVILYEVIFAAQVNAIVVSIATTLFLAAPFTHAAIYGIRNEMLRSSFRRYARRKVQRYCFKDKRRGSVKFLSRKSSTALKIPLKCTVRNDEKQCILGKTMSSQGKLEDIHAGSFENTATCISHRNSVDIFEQMNECPCSQLNNNTSIQNKSRIDEGENRSKDVSFCVLHDITYINPDLVSQASKHEMSFYSNDILKEMNGVDWEFEISKYEQVKNERTQLDLKLGEGKSSDTYHETSSKLRPIKEIIANFEVKRSNKRTLLLKDRNKYERHRKKSKKRQSEILCQDEFSVFPVSDTESESKFEQEILE